MALMKAIDIEYAVANYFGWRRNLIVPNISWGMNLHECDMLIVTRAGYCTEIEIKVTRSDIKADLKKKHRHESDLIKALYFAIPDYLYDCKDFIPGHAGIITVDSKTQYVCIQRQPKEKKVRSLNENEKFQVARLGAMRIWKLMSLLKEREQNENRTSR